MTKPTEPTDHGQTAVATFRIRVAGVLGEDWSGRAWGMTVSVDRSEPGHSFTELVGALPDDAALMGVLDALYTYGARLLIVERIDERGTTIVEHGDTGNRDDVP